MKNQPFGGQGFKCDGTQYPYPVTGIVIFDTLHSVQGDIKYGIGSDSTHRFLSLRAVARSLKRDGAPALIPERATTVVEILHCVQNDTE